jgi:hypothetical protein
MGDVLKAVVEKFGKGFVVFALFITGVFYLYSFTQSQYRESRKDFLVLQMNTIREIVDITSRMSISNDEKEKQALVEKFWDFYFGKLTLVEDVNLARAMVTFARTISEDSTRQKVDHFNFNEMTNRPMNRAALSVAWAGRDVIYRGWTQSFLPFVRPELENSPGQ